MPWVKVVYRAKRIGRGLLAAAILLICPAPVMAQETDRQTSNSPVQTAQIATTVIDDGRAKAPDSTEPTQAAPDPRPQQTTQPAPNPLNYPEQKLAPLSKLIGSEVIATLPPDVYQQRMTPKDKFDLYFYQNYGPQNFILPSFSAAFEMARPPSGYPREWLDGGGVRPLVWRTVCLEHVKSECALAGANCLS